MNITIQRRTIHPKAFAVDGEKLYCIDKFIKCVVIIDMSNKTIYEIISLPEEMVVDDNRCFIHYFGGNIIMVPNNENEVFCCDVSEKKWHRYELEGIKMKRKNMFSSTRIIANCLYLLPYIEPNIIKYNLEINKIEDKEDLFKTLEGQYKESFESINPPSWIDKRTIVGCISKNNAIFINDLVEKKAKIVNFEVPGCVISSAASVGSAILVCDKNNRKVYRVNKENKKIEKEFCLDIKAARITSINSSLAILESINSDYFCILNENLENIYMNHESAECNDNSIDGLGIIAYGEEKGFYYNKYTRMLYAIDCNENVKKMDIFNGLDFSKCDLSGNAYSEVIMENCFYDLKDYLSECFVK